MNKQVRNIAILVLALLGLGSSLFAQAERALVNEGYQLYEDGKYDEAAQKFEAALKINPESYEARFNLMDAFYKQKRYQEAMQGFQELTQSTEDKKQLSDLYHNLGNAMMEQQQYKPAVQAYQEALRQTPGASDTQYNLSYAMQKMRQQQQQQQQNQNQQNQDQQQGEQQEGDEGDEQENQQQQQGNEGEEQDEQEQQGNQNQDGDQQEQEQEQQNGQQDGDQDQEEGDQEQQGGRPEGMSREDAERILEAVRAKEQKVHDKLDRKKAKTASGLIEKDW